MSTVRMKRDYGESNENICTVLFAIQLLLNRSHGKIKLFGAVNIASEFMLVKRGGFDCFIV